MNASLNKKLGNVKWGDYKMGELFQRVKTNKLPYKADELPNQPLGEYTLPCLTSSFNNQGLNYYSPREGATILHKIKVDFTPLLRQLNMLVLYYIPANKLVFI